MNLKTLIAVPLSILLGCTVFAGPDPFKEGDRICFVGDSITKQGGYHAQILLFYATRFPGTRLHVWNSGIAGDTATRGVARYDWDVAPHRPTVVTVMMGMNDVGRSLYAASAKGDAVMARRKKAIAGHIASMEKLAARVVQDGGKLIFMTPSIYDQTGKQEKACFSGVNDALVACGDAARAIAARYEAADCIEFNAPMAAINKEWQAKDPNFTVVGKDRVHPGAMGHLVMAYLFLKAQNVSGTVAVMELDAKAGTVAGQENCRITELSVKEGSISFDCLEKALPFPVGGRGRKALELVPLIEDLNQEVIRVTNLPPGKYELRIDGKAVLKTDHEALAKGLNLAVMESTPQYQQALKVQQLVTSRHRLETKLRAYALLKQQFFPDLEDTTAEQEKEILVKHRETLSKRKSVWNNYRCSMIDSYLKIAPQRKTLTKDCEDLLERAYAASQPVPHHYELLPL